ncbi:MAG: extracellular solute-binding protein [Methanoregulaceae archaeon]|nr:extracellular solute-binding protein [Methanoregulaceae archaeon]
MRRCRPVLVGFLAVALSVLAGAQGAGQNQPAAERTDLVVWGIGLGPDSKGTDAALREFERRNPDIRVKTLTMGAGAMDPQKLMTSIVGNVAPDVISQDRFTVSDWASRGAFLPLDELMQRDQDDPLNPRSDQYYDATWIEASYGGKVYAIPSSADNRVLYWNRAIFKLKAKELRAAGLDPDRAPQTWTELLAYSRVLTEFNKDGTLKRAGFMPNFGNSWLYMFAFMMNAEFMSADGRTCTLNSPEAQKALQFMVDGYEIVGGYDKAKSFESGFLGRENDAFIIGKVAMKIDGDWILSGLARYGPQIDLGASPPPVPDDRFHQRGAFANEPNKWVTWFGGFSYAIPRGARNPEAAWRFIKFMSSTEGRLIDFDAQREWDRRQGRTLIPRVSASEEYNEAVLKRFNYADKKFADALGMHIEMGTFGKGRPPTVVAQTLWNEHVKAMEAALYKNKTPEQALATGQAAVQRDLDAYFQKDRYPELDLGVPVRIGILLALLGLAAAVVWFLRQQLGRLERTEAKWAYLFIAPWVIGFLVFTLGPMVASLFFSFTQWDVLNEARWVGGKNYADLATTDRAIMLKAFGNAAYLAGVGVPLGLATGLLVALLLNAAARGMRVYRTMFYMPAIVPGIASAVLWTWVLTPDPNKGLINAFWRETISPWLGVSPPGWIQSADWAKPALVLMGVWGAGSGMILWLAGLKGVPTSLYEASSIDGATPWRQFWSVTFPQLSSIVFFNTVMGFIGAMQEFDRMYVMRPSKDGPVGPDDAMLTPVYRLFQDAFSFFKMGSASAIAWIIFAIIVILTAIQFKLAPKWVHYEADR